MLGRATTLMALCFGALLSLSLSLTCTHSFTLSHTPLDLLSSCVVVCGGLLRAPITSLAARLVLIGFVMQSEAQGASRGFW